MAFDSENTFDDTSWRILEELQTDARLSMAELGRRIGLSAPATAERVRRLEDAGVIAGYRAQVNVRRAGRPLLAFVRISAYGDVKKRVSEVIQITPEVMEAHRATGSDCFILKLAIRDITHLEQVTDKFTSFGQLTTSIVLSSPLEGRMVERIDLDSSV